MYTQRRQHTRSTRDWSSDVCSSDLSSWSRSIAPRTACSASLLQGAWRPANSRSGEETVGDADVIPGRFLPVGVSQEGRRMVRDDDRDAAEPMNPVAERAEGLPGVEQRLRRRAPHGEDYFRLRELDLAQQIRHAGADLIVLWDAVVRWPALHHVADEHPRWWRSA